MDRDKYVAEAMRQLSDSEVYIPLPDDPTVEIIEKINGRVLGVLLYLGAILRQKGYPSLSALWTISGSFWLRRFLAM